MLLMIVRGVWCAVRCGIPAGEMWYSCRSESSMRLLCTALTTALVRAHVEAQT
jgi:hypothetical protein